MSNKPDSALAGLPVAGDPPVVELHCAVKHFIHGDQSDVQGLSLMVERGEIMVLLGPSGCGKTTTLRLIAGFEQPDAGTVRIAGKPVADRTAQRAAGEARPGHGLPGLCTLPASHRGRERGLRAAQGGPAQTG